MSAFLTFEDVDHHVSCLPREALTRLGTGPIEPDADVGETGDGCRVCDVLKPLVAGRTNRTALHAQELLDWHEVSAVDLFAFAELAGVDLEDEDEGGPPSPVLREILGALSYARCCTIYALAQSLNRAAMAGGYRS